MGENKEYLTHPEELGSIHISEEVLASIAAGAAVEVEGISGLMAMAAKKTAAKGVRVAVDEDGVKLDHPLRLPHPRHGGEAPECGLQRSGVHDRLCRKGGQCPCGRCQFSVIPPAAAESEREEDFTHDQNHRQRDRHASLL